MWPGASSCAGRGVGGLWWCWRPVVAGAAAAAGVFRWQDTPLRGIRSDKNCHLNASAPDALPVQVAGHAATWHPWRRELPPERDERLLPRRPLARTVPFGAAPGQRMSRSADHERMPRSPAPLPPELRPPFACAEALDAGVQPRRLRAHDLTAPFRGMREPASAAFAPPDSAYPLDDARRAEAWHRARQYACVIEPHAFFCGATAAALWGHPTRELHDLDVAVHAPERAPRRRGIRGRKVLPALADVVDLDGLPVTTPATTWAMLGGDRHPTARPPRRRVRPHPTGQPRPPPAACAADDDRGARPSCGCRQARGCTEASCRARNDPSRRDVAP